MLLFAMAAGAIPVQAHHSFAMFDKSKTVTLKGVVSRVEYRNPHVFLFVEVPGRGGARTSWAIECGSVNYVSRVGWKPNTVNVGEKVTVTINPLRNGKEGGSIVALTLPNGKVIEG